MAGDHVADGGVEEEEEDDDEDDDEGAVLESEGVSGTWLASVLR